MKTAHILVGLPATGKSYLVDKIKGDLTSCWIYSTDMYIEAMAEDSGLTYDEVFESNIQDATRFNNEKVEFAAQMGIDVIWDQTNLGLRKRKKILDFFKGYGYRVECHGIRPPDPEKLGFQLEWRRRLDSREGKTIPLHVMSNMLQSYHEPSDEEGFDKVSYYNMWGDLLYTTEPLV